MAVLGPFVPLIAGASIAVGAYGAYEQNRVTRKAAREEVLVAEEEAQQLDERAAQTLAAGSYNSDRIRTRAAEIIAEAKAKAAANGGDTTSGSALEIRKKSITESSIDQLLVMKDAADDAAKDKKQAKITRQTGQRMGDRLKSQAKANLVGDIATLAGKSASWKETYS